jgi:hypothetical protein
MADVYLKFGNNGRFLPITAVAAAHRGFVVVETPSSGSFKLYEGSYALLIGESNYTEWPRLQSIPKELQQIEELLTAQEFTVVKKLDLNSDELKQEFDNFINQYGFDKNNRLLFFFSGHGYSRQEGNKGYIVPVDAPNPKRDDKGFAIKAVEMQQVMAWARRIEAKHALFIFDSCFSGTIFLARNLPDLTTTIDEQVVAQPVRQFISAGSADEEVPAKSILVPVFIDALKNGKADLNRDGYVLGDELGSYLKEEVRKYAQQTPQYDKIKDYDLAQGNFVFKINRPSQQVVATPTFSQLNSPTPTTPLPATTTTEKCKVLVFSKECQMTHWQGNCVNGLGEGEVTAECRHTEGIHRYQGEMKGGKPHGKGTYYFPSGNIYNGEWQNGKRNGWGLFKHRDGGCPFQDYNGHLVNDQCERSNCCENHWENNNPTKN